jgi:hypothetical protein
MGILTPAIVVAMGKGETYRDTLSYALAIAGCEQALAEYLNVTRSQLEHWLDHADEMPDPVFLAVVDMAMDASRDASARSRELRARLLGTVWRVT